jgi:hypothetical protein
VPKSQNVICDANGRVILKPSEKVVDYKRSEDCLPRSGNPWIEQYLLADL